MEIKNKTSELLSKKRHYLYIHKLLNKASKLFSNLAGIVEEYEDLYEALSDHVQLRNYKRCKNKSLMLKRTDPSAFVIYSRDYFDDVRDKYPGISIFDCFVVLKRNFLSLDNVEIKRQYEEYVENNGKID